MRIIAEFDEKNYQSDWRKYHREAVRAIIVRDGRIALVKSKAEGFYKLPGGGIEAGENHQQTVIRETLEETGLQIKPESICEYGMIIERRASVYNDKEAFEQLSYYYTAEITDDEPLPQMLSESEQKLDFVFEWVDIKHAYETNMLCYERENKNETYLLREAAALCSLMQ